MQAQKVYKTSAIKLIRVSETELHILCLNLQQPKTVSDPPRCQDLGAFGNWASREVNYGSMLVPQPILSLPSSPLALLIFSHQFNIQMAIVHHLIWNSLQRPYYTKLGSVTVYIKSGIYVIYTN